jgi:HEPN domain-containing protein
MKDLRDLAFGWLRKAESDLTTAQVMLASDGPYDTACFHAQQSAEKCLKYFLALAGQPIPRTHDLIELNQLCAAAAQNWQVDNEILSELMPYAVETRYDLDFFPDKETAAEAVALAEQVQFKVLAVISIEKDINE